MRAEDIVEGLNRHIEDRRSERDIPSKGHLVLQRVVEPHPTFKVYKTYKAILKYGWENMMVTILYSEDRNVSTNDLLNKLEIEFISKYNTLTPNGYNLKSGGNQPTLSDITKQRMSKSAKGRLLSEEHKRKLSIAQNKDWVKEKKSLTHRRRVVQLSINGEVIKEWYSITEVSKTLGVNASGISHACKNGGKSHGYRWEYIS